MSVSGRSELPAIDYERIVTALEESVRRNIGDGLLLSGGLDTAIIAYLASKWTKPSCITVALRGAPAPDIDYARLIANRLNLEHYVHYFDEEELYESIQEIIRIMKTFDPMEVRNSAAGYIGLKTGKAKGLSTIMTGDGADELFAGYSFLFKLNRDELDIALKKLWASMRFSSMYIAEDLGLDVKLPFLDSQFKSFAIDLDVELKVRNERGQTWGKWILRKAFESILSEEVVWRTKAPIEVGTGTTTLPAFFNAKISALEFNEKKTKYLNEDKVVIRDKEHLFYYEYYRSLLGVPYTENSNIKSCPDCGVNVAENVTFCRTCGAYPI